MLMAGSGRPHNGLIRRKASASSRLKAGCHCLLASSVIPTICCQPARLCRLCGLCDYAPFRLPRFCGRPHLHGRHRRGGDLDFPGKSSVASITGLVRSAHRGASSLGQAALGTSENYAKHLQIFASTSSSCLDCRRQPCNSRRLSASAVC